MMNQYQNQNQNLHQCLNEHEEGLLVNMESCVDRASQAILFHCKEYPLDYIARTFFPAESNEDQIKSALESDDRFVLSHTEEGVMVDRAIFSITASERQVRAAVEQWKNDMAHYFKSIQGDVKMCALSQIVKRPQGVPRGVKLIDVLNTDSQRRFLLLSNPSSSAGHSAGRKVDEVMVKYKCTPFEVEAFHEEWRESLAEYLIRQDEPVALVTIGTHVTKPKNLGKNQKLIDVVKMDRQNRFRSIADPTHNSLTRLTVTDDYCCQKWRENIYQLWKSSSFRPLKSLDYSRTPRPRALKGNYSVLDMIVEDPLKRFQDADDFSHLHEIHLEKKYASVASYHRRPPRPPPLLLPAAQIPFNPSQRPGNVHSTPLGSWARGHSSGVDARHHHHYQTLMSSPLTHHSSARCHPSSRQQDQQKQDRQCYGPPSYSHNNHHGSQSKSAPPGVINQGPHLSPLSTTHPPSPPPGFARATPAVVDLNMGSQRLGYNNFSCDDENMSHYANQTEFSCYDDPSPPMPDILKNITRHQPVEHGTASLKMTPYSVHQSASSSLDDDVAAEYKEMDTAPGLFRFLSN